MLTTRSAPTACLSMSQQSLMKKRCVLASCRAGLWSSFKHLAGFLKLKRMPCRSLFTQLLLGRASSSSESSHPCTRPLIVTAPRHSTSVSCVRIHQGSPLSSAADDMQAGRHSS